MNSEHKKILIFPAGMPRSVAYLNKCKKEGRDIVGSSSLAYDPVRNLYPSWVYLPYVTDPQFKPELQKIITEFNIGEIYTPNLVVWDYLEKNLGHLALGVELANSSPVDEVLDSYRDALKKAKNFANTIPSSK